nr:hypothetical protein [Tanacetum cinerariifolium]
MTLPDDIRDVPMNEFKAKVGRGRPRKSTNGAKIKVCTPGSTFAGAGAVLKCLRSSKISGKAHDRVESSPIDFRGGKRVVTTPVSNGVDKVLSDLKSCSINCHLKFAIGSSNEQCSVGCPLSKETNANDDCNGNDGSFIKLLFDNSPIKNQSSHVAKSNGRKISFENTDMGDVSSIDCDQTSSRDGITSAKTGNGFESVLRIHIASYKDGMDLEFRKMINQRDYLRSQLLFCLLFSLVKIPSGNQFDRFAEKLKQGTEELALKMDIPLVLSLFKEMFYGYFVGTSMDYRVVSDNLMRMWRIHGIEDLTKTNLGKIMSGLGKPLVMDKMTKERCLKKACKFDFARVLVEVNANDDLSSVLEISYPPLGNRHANIGKLDVKYQWKPPLCTHCKTFGHSTLSCKIRPRTGEELVKSSMNQDNIVSGVSKINRDGNGNGDDGFVTMGVFCSWYVKSNFKKPGRGVDQVKFQVRVNDNDEISKDPNFKLKVLLRGSNSKNSSVSASEEAIPINNSFQLLEVEDLDRGNLDGGINVQKEFDSKLWPALKEEVDILMEYDPSFKDDDVASEKDGIKVVAWNVRSLIKAPNQKQVIQLLGDDNIIVDWDPNCINVMVMEQTTQVIHCFMEPLDGDKKFHCSFIYAHVHTFKRRSLWRFLQKYKRSIQDAPWVILGDFNATLDPFEKYTDGSEITIAIGEFRDCVLDIDMEDITMSGLMFIWNKKPGKTRGLLKNFDRVMGNVELMSAFPSTFALSKNNHKPNPHKDEESFLKQKAKTEWFKESDRNSKFFHNVISPADVAYMVTDITIEEIKCALFDIDGNKAPGPDGFFAHFLKSSWAVIGGELCKAVKESFKSGKLLKENALDELGNISGLLPSLSKSKLCLSRLVISLLERLMRDFLWNFGEFKKCKAKIRWSDVCKPKIEGGLGIRSHDTWNIALISKHLWNLLSFKDSLWVKCVHMYKLKGRSFWDIPNKEGSSWIWRRILKVRCLLRDHIVSKIRDGKGTSLWFDNWHLICFLSNFISKRKIHYFGLSLKTKVVDVIDRGKWKWPKVSCDEFDGLLCINPFVLFEYRIDKIMWRTNSGRHKNFNVSPVWYALREDNHMVP